VINVSKKETPEPPSLDDAGTVETAEWALTADVTEDENAPE
jgi:hypothetical protein